MHYLICEMIQRDLKLIFYRNEISFEFFQKQIHDHVKDLQELKWKVYY